MQLNPLGSKNVYIPPDVSKITQQNQADAAAVTAGMTTPKDNGEISKPGLFKAAMAAAKEKAGQGKADLSKLMSARPEMKWQNRAVICNWMVNVVAAAIIANAPAHIGLHSMGVLNAGHTLGGSAGLAAVISFGLILTTIATAYAVHKTGMKPSEYFMSSLKGAAAGTVGVLASAGGAVLVGLVSAKAAAGIAAGKTSTAAASALHTTAAAGGTHGTVAAAGGAHGTVAAAGTSQTAVAGTSQTAVAGGTTHAAAASSLAGHTVTASAATTAPVTAGASTTTAGAGGGGGGGGALLLMLGGFGMAGLGGSSSSSRRSVKNQEQKQQHDAAVSEARSSVAQGLGGTPLGAGGPAPMARLSNTYSPNEKVDPDAGRSLESLELEFKDLQQELDTLKQQQKDAEAPIERGAARGQDHKLGQSYADRAGEIDTRMDRLQELIEEKERNDARENERWRDE